MNLLPDGACVSNTTTQTRRFAGVLALFQVMLIEEELPTTYFFNPRTKTWRSGASRGADATKVTGLTLHKGKVSVCRHSMLEIIASDNSPI